MKKYEFTVPIYGELTADEAAAELERIRLKHGELTPEKVVDESRGEGAVLHGIFEWDDTKAAERWRNEQARQLIKNITVTVIDEEVTTTVRAIVNVVTSDSFGKRVYVPFEKATLDDTAYNDLLDQAKADMEKFIAKYAQLKELNSVKREMLAVINGIIPIGQ